MLAAGHRRALLIGACIRYPVVTEVKANATSSCNHSDAFWCHAPYVASGLEVQQGDSYWLCVPVSSVRVAPVYPDLQSCSLGPLRLGRHFVTPPHRMEIWEDVKDMAARALMLATSHATAGSASDTISLPPPVPSCPAGGGSPFLTARTRAPGPLTVLFIISPTAGV